MTEQTAAPAPQPAPTPAQEPSMAQIEELLRADEQAEMTGDEPEAEPEAPAEEAPPPPEPEAQAEEPEQAKGGDLRVALREERERRRQAEALAAQTEQNQRILAAAMQQLRQQMNPQQPPPPAPDFETDPAGYLKTELGSLQQWAKQMQEQQAAQAQAFQQQQATAQAEQAVVGQEAAFVKAQPDYYEAVDFMRQKLASKMEVLGVPKEQIAEAVATDMRAFGLKALQAGQNPAEKLFRLAKIEGYNGSAQANSDRLSTIAKGAAATRGARSTAPASNGEMTLEQAARLSYKDLGKMSDDQFQRLMGG
jgi:hypothetical protein